MHPHLPRNVACHHVPVPPSGLERGVGRILGNLALLADEVILQHGCQRSKRGLEVGLLEQRLVLLTHHVVLHLRHEIHRYNHNDQ